MRRTLVVFAVMAGLVASSLGAQADPQGKKIAHLTTGTAQAYIAALAKSFTDASKTYGMEVTTFSSPFDAALQAQQMDDAIARKFDMIVLVAVSEQAIVPAATRAHQAGIPIIVLIEPPKPGTEDLYITNVGEDQVELGRIAGTSIVNAFKASGRDGGKVAAVTGSLQEGIAPLRLQGFKDALKADPKIDLAAVEDAAWDPVKSATIASQLFARFAAQGGLGAIYGMNDSQAVAIVNAAESAGLNPGAGAKDLVIVGSNCVPETIGAIKSGKLYSSASQIPTRLGERAAAAAADYFSGKTLPKTIHLPVDVINKSNIDQWVGPCTY